MALPEDDALLGRREAAAALTSAGVMTLPLQSINAHEVREQA